MKNIKFLISKKKYTKDAAKEKERIDTLVSLKDIKENGLLEYNNGYYGYNPYYYGYGYDSSTGSNDTSTTITTTSTEIPAFSPLLFQIFVE